MKQFYSNKLTNGATKYSITQNEINQVMSDKDLDILFISMVNFARPSISERKIKFRFDNLHKAGLSFDKETMEYLDSITLDILQKYKI